jgi:hypothetical protein
LQSQLVSHFGGREEAITRLEMDLVDSGFKVPAGRGPMLLTTEDVRAFLRDKPPASIPTRYATRARWDRLLDVLGAPPSERAAVGDSEGGADPGSLKRPRAEAPGAPPAAKGPAPKRAKPARKPGSERPAPKPKANPKPKPKPRAKVQSDAKPKAKVQPVPSRDANGRWTSDAKGKKDKDKPTPKPKPARKPTQKRTRVEAPAKPRTQAAASSSSSSSSAAAVAGPTTEGPILLMAHTYSLTKNTRLSFRRYMRSKDGGMIRKRRIAYVNYGMVSL